MSIHGKWVLPVDNPKARKLGLPSYIKHSPTLPKPLEIGPGKWFCYMPRWGRGLAHFHFAVGNKKVWVAFAMVPNTRRQSDLIKVGFAVPTPTRAGTLTLSCYRYHNPATHCFVSVHWFVRAFRTPKVEVFFNTRSRFVFAWLYPFRG